MSKIVNTGIQQGGIENAARVIRQGEWDRVMLFMGDNDRTLAKKSYSLLDGSSSTPPNTKRGSGTIRR